MVKKDTILLYMLAFVPISFVVQWLHLSPIIIFFIAGLAIIPLAAWIANSTEEIAEVIGPSLGGLLNATFGNATEMIVSIVALNAGLVEVVRASLIGGIISNLLLALGLAVFLGGLRFKEQSFNPTVARINASSLNLALIVLLTPAAIEATSKVASASLGQELDYFSRAAAILLLTFYGLMLFFSMKTHSYMYLLEESEVETVVGEVHETEQHRVNLKLQIGILLTCTLVLVFVSDTLVDSLEQAITTLHLSHLFTGVILIPIFGGIVEYITCITCAMKNKMEVAVAVGIGSSLQIALFVAPALVLIGWAIGKPMDLHFNLFEIVAVAMAVLITNSISDDGRSNWLEGVLLLMTYAVLGIAFYVHP